ncbi:hypothetical protein [Aeoliella sp.]|uniref:hypothetical protein n=1 Tax=Aeoliella sp. TaxID=2795800 RepID=UPI003CCBD19B
MPTSGLVISTSQDADLQPLLAALGTRDCITCGEALSGRLPIVTVTAGKSEDKALWDWLWSLPGVTSVDIAFIYLEDEVSPTTADDGQPSHVGRAIG